MSTSTFTLLTKATIKVRGVSISLAPALVQTPATNHTINELVITILENFRPDERITLKYDTCRLLCQDEAERREFPDTVSVMEACETLFASQDPPVYPADIVREVEAYQGRQ